MADSNVPQYPAMFDPSQMLNKYSTMNAQSFPMYNYYGTPTDAMGRPISSYRAPAPAPVAPAQPTGTTLNSQPQMIYQMLSAGGQYTGGASGGQAGGQMAGQNVPATYGWVPNPSYRAPVQQAPQQAVPSSGFNYLTALANPDKVVTPGVTPPPRSSQPGPINLDALIANMRSPGMTPPPGGYGQGATGLAGGVAPSSGFLNTLAALRAGSPGAK
jgi:hypothetical protein